MRFGNTISMVLILVAMMIIIGALVSFMGKGFSMYTADKMSQEIQMVYDSLYDKEDFAEVLKMYSEEEEKTELPPEMQELILEMREANEHHLSETDIQVMSNFTFFEYKVFYKDDLIYDSYAETREMTAMDQYSNENVMSKNMFSESGAPIFDADGKVIGKVDVRVSPDIINMVYFVSFALAFIIFIVNSVISKIIIAITSNMVSKPLETLAFQMEDMANEDLEDAFNTQLNVKRPVSEVKSLTDSTAKIMNKMAHYYELMTAQNQELEAQRDTLEYQREELEAQTEELEAQRDELESQNDQLTQYSGSLQSMNNAYLSRTLKLQNLLDNVGQGFMTFGKDLTINSEYSVACTHMLCEADCDDETHGDMANGVPHVHEGELFDEDITGMKVTDLLIHDTEQREFIDELFTKILNGSENERNLFIPLLPEEIEMKGRIHSIEYKIVNDELANEQMMIILTDITQTRELEQQMEVERDILQMIVKVLLNRDEFLTNIEEFNAYLDQDLERVTQDDFDEMLRVIHTFKGSFAQYYMNNTSNHLNEIEDVLYADGSIDAIKAIDRDLVRQKLGDDLSIIEGYVGKDFIYKKDLYTVEEEKIIEIEQKIKRILPATEFNKVIPIIQSIRYRSVKEGLKSYPDYVTKLSERLDKSVAPFEITGDDVSVDFDVYQNVFKSMVHLFRNAVDHGVEDPDTRIELDKHEAATIKCEVVDKGESFEVIIEDDGRGMSFDVQAKIFEQGFSTKDSATAISGRGVGLPALLSAVEVLGGKITVESTENVGTKFTVSLPILHGTDIVHFEPEQFMHRIEKIADKYLRDLNFKFEPADVNACDQITLHRVSALLNMKGSIDGLMIVSANEAFAKDLVGAFVLDEVAEEDLAAYAEDVLGEVTNTILGNVLGSLEAEGVFLSIGVPVMLSNRSAYVKYSDRQILNATFEMGDHVISLSLLITEGNEQLEHISFEDDIIDIYNPEGGL